MDAHEAFGFVAYCELVLVTVTRRFRGREDLVAYAVVVLVGALAALLAVARIDGSGPLDRPEFRTVTTLPVIVYPVALVGLATLVLAYRVWWISLASFFAWLPFEDLARKLAGNDLRLYFVKDLLLGIALLSLAPKIAGRWRKPLGELLLPTMLVLSVALIYSVPSALTNPSIALVGLHQKFLFAALFPVGVFIAHDRDRLASAMFGLALLSAAVCLVGIAQVFFGPTFLNPEIVTDPALQHLVVIKTIGVEQVLRPSGPFADVSRFASMTIVSVLLGFCSLRLARSAGRRRLSVVAIAASMAGAFASGSRTSLLVCVPLAAFALLFGQRRRFSARSPLALIAVAIVGAISLTPAALTETSAKTAAFYTATLNPTSGSFDAGFRVRTYANDALKGVSLGGLTGRGTGNQSTGRQYLTSSRDIVERGTESGWGSVAIEWGLTGLVIWVTWAVMWTRKAIRVANSSDGPAGPIRGLIAFYIAALLIVMFALGSGFFENYIANIFFWFLSGVTFATPPEVARQTLYVA